MKIGRIHKSFTAYAWKKIQFLHYNYFLFMIYDRIFKNVFSYSFINTSL